MCIASEVYMHCELLGLCSVVCICSSCVIYLFFSCLTSRVKMVRPLSQGKQQNVLSLLQKGCSVREIAKSLQVGKSVYRGSVRSIFQMQSFQLEVDHAS